MVEWKVAFAAWLCLAACSVALAQMADSLDDIVPEAAMCARVATDLQFTEGPAWDGKGNLFFTDIPANRIHKLDAAGKLEVFLEPSRNANGLIFDPEGNLLACRHDGRDVVRISPEGEVTALAESCDGKKFNSPNDLVRAKDGSIYFTDPRYGLAGRPQEQQVEGVYRIAPDGAVTRVVDDMTRPNGILLSPDGKTLYVADTEDKRIRAYSVQADGSVSDGRDFAGVPSGGADGMAMDVQGNIYCTCGDGVAVYTPAGESLGAITVPEKPANCTFGGADWQTLYITARTSVYRIPLKIAGLH